MSERERDREATLGPSSLSFYSAADAALQPAVVASGLASRRRRGRVAVGGDVGRAGLLYVNQRGGVVMTDSPDLTRCLPPRHLHPSRDEEPSWFTAQT